MKMAKRRWWVILIIFLVGSLSVLGTEVEEKVFSELEEKGEASVIVVLEEDKGTASGDLEVKKEAIKEKQEEVLEKLNLEEKKGFLGIATEEKDFELEHQYSTINAFSGEVTEEGLEKLAENGQVKKIFLNEILHPSLTTSVPQIKASSVWNLTAEGYNITGKGESVCVIDTGIDTDHSAFTGRIIGQYCYCSASDYGGGGCCPDNTAEDDNAEDGHGHGTHVAGIAVGNHSTYRGVAPEAGIIAIKVCDNAAQASCTVADAIAGIQWCTNNASKYNISVISMSLGGGGPYNSYCNDYVLASAINSAVGANISVVVAAGNEGYTTGISAPACVENATPVGGVDSSDNIYYNRGNILDILAPSKSITSTYNNGGTASLSGTSMAAPHVSGAIVLLRQYWRQAYNQTLTPQQAENKLIITGKQVSDSSSGRNYSRIDILKAVQPFINFSLDSPANGTTISASWALINITADVNLSIAVLEWNHSNGTIVNYTMNLSSQINFYYNMTVLGTGNHSYKVYGNDSANTWGESQGRVLEVDQTVPTITINYPGNNSFHRESFNLNISITDLMLAASWYNLINASGNSVQNNTNLSINSASFNWTELVNASNSTFNDGNYSLTVFANDTQGSFLVKTINFTVDKTAPLLFGIDKTPEIVYNNETVVFGVNTTDLYLNSSRIYLSANYSGSWANYTMSWESGERYIHTLGKGNLTNQKNIGYKFYAGDYAGNFNASAEFSFAVENRNINFLNITTPANGTVLEIGLSNQFNSIAEDPDNDTLTYVWDFGDGTAAVNGQNSSHQFNASGTFTVKLNASDGLGSFNQTNTTIVVDDMQGPNITSISYDNSVHIQSEGNQSVSIKVFDYSGIFNVTLYFNGTLKEGTCSQGNTGWNCSWSWGFSTYGNYNFTINSTDNFTVPHTNSSVYTFTVTSCSDGVQNGNEGGVDCGGSCTSSCGGGSNGGNGGGGGGGGGGGMVSTATTTPEVKKEVKAEGGVKKKEEKKAEAAPGETKEKTEEAKGIETMAAPTEEKQSLVGRAFSYLGGYLAKVSLINLGAKGKALAGIGGLIIILLGAYLILRRRD